MTGSQDGSVHIWEWGHPQTVAEPRAAGTFAKVTRVRFSQHGNKFGVADGDGNLSLFNVGLTSSNYRPFYVSIIQYHYLGILNSKFFIATITSSPGQKVG